MPYVKQELKKKQKDRQTEQERERESLHVCRRYICIYIYTRRRYMSSHCLVHFKQKHTMTRHNVLSETHKSDETESVCPCWGWGAQQSYVTSPSSPSHLLVYWWYGGGGGGRECWPWLDAPALHEGQQLVWNLCQNVLSQPCHAQHLVP